MSKSLIEHTDELNALMVQADYLEQNGEEIPQEILDQITNALTQQSEKVDRCVAWVNRAKSEIEWLKSEKQAIDAQIKRVERSIERMHTLAGFVMKNLGERRLNGLKGHSFSERKSKAVIVADLDQLPKEYVTASVSFKADKVRIKEAIESGDEIPGAYLEERINIVSK